MRRPAPSHSNLSWHTAAMRGENHDTKLAPALAVKHKKKTALHGRAEGQERPHQQKTFGHRDQEIIVQNVQLQTIKGKNRGRH
jgi:hypothetical protein